MVDLSIDVAGGQFYNPLFWASGEGTSFGEKIRKLALEGKPGGIFTKSVSVDTGQKWGRGAKQPTPLCWPWIEGKGRLEMNVICAKGEPEKCIGCGQCETICTWLCQPTRPAAIQVDKESKKARVNLEKSIGCGYCFCHCPAKAITLKGWGTG